MSELLQDLGLAIKTAMEVWKAARAEREAARQQVAKQADADLAAVSGPVSSDDDLP